MANTKNVKKKSLIFGITKLDIGGAERVLVDIANNLCDKFDITIFTIYSDGILEKELDSKIEVYNLFKKQNFFLTLYLFFYSKKIYNKFINNRFQLQIAFLEGPITKLFSYGNKNKIAWVHNDIKYVFGSGIKGFLKKRLNKKIYKKYNKIIFVSESNKKSFEDFYGLISKREVIYNYIDKKRILKNEIKKQKNKDIPILVTVARLVKQKGIERFIKVHKRIIDDGIFHKIYVIGEGNMRKKLEYLINKFNVRNSFILLGKLENPYSYIDFADYFCLFSLYEGYGMVIEEAKILGKNILITNTAAVEAVKNYKKSFIIENNENDIYINLKKILLKQIDFEDDDIKYELYDNSYILEKLENIFNEFGEE